MQRENGRLITWNTEKGYGFIRPMTGGSDVFLHAKDLQISQRMPRVNDQITYLLEVSDTDKHNAKDARICGFAWSFFTLLCVSVVPLLGVYAYGVWQYQLPLYPIAIVYICMSLITVVVYHHDKCSAKTGAWRISENTLHALEIFGGWPGAFLAQFFFRHKLKKASYQITFWAIVIGHSVMLYAFASDSPVRKYAMTLPDKLASAGVFLKTVSVPIKSLSSTTPILPQPEYPAPTPPPTTALEPAEDTWTNTIPSEPLIIDPSIRRSLVMAPKQLRRLTGEIKAVSSAHGLLVSLKPEIEADGTIAPSTLIDDFHRYFRVGEQIDVVIQRISMKGRQKYVDLLLVEP